MEITTQSSNKRCIVSYGEQNTPSIDRLSSLPDDIICHILSFLPTKLSGSTSILARRWRFLWEHVPNFDFEGDRHLRPLENSSSSLVNNVFSRSKVKSLNTFSLSRDYGFCEDELQTWVTYAIERNVRNIIFHLELSNAVPQCLFICKTLVDLRIDNCMGIPSSGEIHLPSLKILHLGSIEYEVEEALPYLLTRCPVLEELLVYRIVDRDLDCCNIFSPTIKRLIIDFPFDDDYFYNPFDRVKINAPSLRYLQIDECSYEYLSLVPVNSLIEAVICFDIYKLEVDFYLYTRAVLDFIDSLCKVKFLKISGFCEFPEAVLARPNVRFENLTRLELAVDWHFIPKFLECADSLNILIINKVDENLKLWMEPVEERCVCLSSSLQTVTINDFGCTYVELNMVIYILRHAQVLKRMEIHCSREGISLEAKFDALQRISLVHRGSRVCELAFS